MNTQMGFRRRTWLWQGLLQVDMMDVGPSCGQKSARISNCIRLRISLYVEMSLGQDKLPQHHAVVCLLEHRAMAQMLHHVTMPDQMLIRW